MKSVCLRSVSPHGTLPRSSRRSRVGVISPRRGTDADGSETPHASITDVREEKDRDGRLDREKEIISNIENNSLMSLMHRDREEDDQLTDLPGNATLPRPRVLAAQIKAKRLRFYRNGDQYYKGLAYALRADRLRTMKPLFEELTRAMADSTALPHGVRHIFTLDGQARILDVKEFVDGESYVCSSSETFKQVDYENAREPLWSMAVARAPRPHDTSQMALNISYHAPEPTDFVYPRIITVIRNGVKPRRVVRHLLNKRTARSFTQVITDLTPIVKLDSGAIRKLYALGGTQVMSLVDFFLDDDVFIAYGNERTTSDDFYVSTEESARLYSRGNRRNTSLRRVMPQRNESLRHDRSGSVLEDETARRLPTLLSGRMNVVRLLGDGNTALVYEVTDKESTASSALKIIGRENVIGKEQLIDSEIAIMKKISHENILQLFDVWSIEGSFYLQLELIQGGDLFEYLCVCRRVTERSAARLVGSLARALHYLHERRIVHRDVKPENLLLTSDANGDLDLKLADFGLAAELPEEGRLNTICGTPTYVAAEVLGDWGYDEKVDVWALGVILYVILCGFPPFQSGDGEQEELFRQILRGKYNFPSPAWDQISWAAKALILCTVNLDVSERFDAECVIENHWVQRIGNSDPEYEVMAQKAVENRLDVEPEEEVEETHREFYYSRRTSMDELSECADFEYTRAKSYAHDI